MSETRKIAAILAADVVGFSRLAGADEDRTLARLRALRSDLIDPTIAVHHGRVFKRTGDGLIVEFRSVVDAVRCAIEVQHGMAERNEGVAPEKRIELRIGVHLGDVVEESGRRSHGRRRQHRCAARGRRRAGRDLSVRGRLPAGARPGEGDVRRSRRKGTQEHCPAGARLRGANPVARRRGRVAASAQSSLRPRRARRSPSCPSPT